MERAVKQTIETCREKGIDTLATCSYSGWNKKEHEDMHILYTNPPADIKVTYKVNHGVHDWTLVRIGERKTEPIHGHKTQPYALDIDFSLLKAQKACLVNLSEFVDQSSSDKDNLEAVINLIDEIQDQAVDHHGVPEKEVFHLTDEATIFDDEGRVNVSTGDEDCTDFEHPVTAKDIEFESFRAYQHFLYYVDVNHLREANPWGEHLTGHFLGKLHTADTHSIVSWVQEMSAGNQKLLLKYILFYHSNKW